MKYLFAVNPNSGNKKAMKRMNKLKNRLDQANVDYIIFETKPSLYADELKQMIIDHAITHVFAVGGDGTAHEVLNAIVDLNVKYGIIPFGSGNDFARMMGIKKQIDDVMKMILEDRYQLIDIGQFNERYFLNYFSFGFDVDICESATQNRGRFGASYVLGFFKALFRFKSRKIQVNQQTNFYCTTSIHNGKYYGGGIKINPLADVQDGQLNFVAIKKVSRFKLFFIYAFLFLGIKIKGKNIIQSTKQQLTFYLDEPRLAGVDGELYTLNQQVNIRIIPKRVKFIY